MEPQYERGNSSPQHEEAQGRMQESARTFDFHVRLTQLPSLTSWLVLTQDFPCISFHCLCSITRGQLWSKNNICLPSPERDHSHTTCIPVCYGTCSGLSPFIVILLLCLVCKFRHAYRRPNKGWIHSVLSGLFRPCLGVWGRNLLGLGCGRECCLLQLIFMAVLFMV